MDGTQGYRRVTLKKHWLTGKNVVRKLICYALFLKLFFGSVAIAAPASSAPNPESAISFVRTGLYSVADVLRQHELSDADKSTKLRELLRRDFDIRGVAKFALGKYGRRLEKDKFNIYLEAFEDHLVATYVVRLVNHVGPTLVDAALNKVQILGTRPAGGKDLYVRTGIARQEGHRPIAIDWRIRQKDDQLKVIDVYFLGVSQALTYKQEFTSVIQRAGNGVDGLIAALKQNQAKRESSP